MMNKSNKNYLRYCSEYSGLDHLSSAFKHDRNHIIVSTNQSLVLENIEPYTEFKKFVGKNKNYVCFDIEKYDSNYWRRIAYRKSRFNIRAKVIYHFLNDRFFYEETFYSDARNIDIDQIRKSLCEKYGILPARTEDKFKINSKEAFIFFDYTGINLSIKCVLTEDKFINDFLRNQLFKFSNPHYHKSEEILEKNLL